MSSQPHRGAVDRPAARGSVAPSPPPPSGSAATGGSASVATHEYAHLAPLFDELAALDPGDPGRGELRERLITGHLPLAEHIARRFCERGVPREDLVQVATLGLINAVDRFTPERGVDFLSFAVPTITGEVRRHFRDTAWAVRVPRRLQELHLELGAATGELSQRLGRSPTPSELAAHLGHPLEEVYEGLEAGLMYQSSSLDEALAGADRELPALAATIGEEDPALENIEEHESLRPLIEGLGERDRRILAMRFFAGMTQTQIAERLGISQMQVSRLLTRTLQALRSKLDEGA